MAVIVSKNDTEWHLSLKVPKWQLTKDYLAQRLFEISMQFFVYFWSIWGFWSESIFKSRILVSKHSAMEQRCSSNDSTYTLHKKESRIIYIMNDL